MNWADLKMYLELFNSGSLLAVCIEEVSWNFPLKLQLPANFRVTVETGIVSSHVWNGAKGCKFLDIDDKDVVIVQY